MRIAIIILNYNTSKDCHKCISYIKRQQGVETTIVVVDNCSAKEDVDKLAEICISQGVTLIRNKENRGYSAGNNIGLRYAAEQRLEYALIINPDMELHQENYLQRLVEEIRVDSNIAVAATDIVNVEGNHHNPIRETHYFEELFWFIELIKNKVFRKQWYVTDYTKSGYCEKLSGCCFLIRMSFVKQIGFLDEHTFLYCEEPILAKQVQQLHAKMYYIADIQAFHNHIKSEKGNSAKRMEIFAASRNYYWDKYSGYSHFAVWLLKLSRKLHQIIFSRIK